MEIIATPAFSNKESNPYNYLLYNEIEKKSVCVNESWGIQSLFASKIWHVHWPESFLGSKNFLGCLVRLCLLTLKIIVAKTFRLKIIWTVHNVRPHENKFPILANAFYKYFPFFCDGFIFLSKESFEKSAWISTASKRKKVIYHGHYKSVLVNLVGQSEAKEKLNISQYSKVYLFFGLIRGYKGVPRLIREFIKLNEKTSCLCVVGSSLLDEELSKEMAQLADGHDNVLLNDKFVNEQELQLWVSAADLIVLPYEKITNSGSVLYALSANKQVVAPRLGALAEIKDNVGEWLQLYEGRFNGALLQQVYSEGLSGNVNLALYEWKLIAEQTIEFYCEVLE